MRRALGCWLRKEFSRFSMNDMMRNWATYISITIYRNMIVVSCWIPPVIGKVKINFNRASFRNPGLVVMGVSYKTIEGI